MAAPPSTVGLGPAVSTVKNLNRHPFASPGRLGIMMSVGHRDDDRRIRHVGDGQPEGPKAAVRVAASGRRLSRSL